VNACVGRTVAGAGAGAGKERPIRDILKVLIAKIEVGNSRSVKERTNEEMKQPKGE
jgi:hypothetical protein